MITLLGHGYIGNGIAKALLEAGVPFAWPHHGDEWEPSGVIINAAGYTGTPNVDACEDNKADCIYGNVAWPLLVESKAGGLPVIHISSGCVYTGYKDGGWLETDSPNFGFPNGSFYAGCKAVSQNLFENWFSGKSYLLRIRMPLDAREHPKNFLTKLRKYPKLIDVRNSLSRVRDVAAAVVYFAQKLPPAGVYNLCNPGSVTTREVADFLGLQKEWFTEEEFAASVKAPRSFCVLNTDKMQAIYRLPQIWDALHDCR